MNPLLNAIRLEHEEELIFRFEHFMEAAIRTSAAAVLRTQQTKEGPIVSFNFATPLKVPEHYYLDIPVPAGSSQRLLTRDEFVESMPELLHLQYSNDTLSTLVKILTDRIGGFYRYLSVGHGKVMLVSARLVLLIQEE